MREATLALPILNAVDVGNLLRVTYVSFLRLSFESS